MSLMWREMPTSRLTFRDRSSLAQRPADAGWSFGPAKGRMVGFIFAVGPVLVAYTRRSVAGRSTWYRSSPVGLFDPRGARKLMTWVVVGP